MTSNQIEYAKHTENVRHNKATEGLSSGNLQELVRHNKASEGISSGNLDEMRRHNIMSENLTHQQIVNNYTVGLRQANAAQASAAAAQKQANVASKRQYEDSRHNSQMEALSMYEIERKYSNLAGQLNEAERHNRKSEDLQGNKIIADTFGNLADFAGDVIKTVR